MSGSLLSASAPIAAAAFSPTDITGLKLWANPDVDVFQTIGGTPATADADPVGEILEHSGLTQNMTQVTSTKRPTLKLATHNSKNTLLFDGVDDTLGGAVVNGVGTGDFWWIVAAKVGGSKSDGTLFSSTGGTPGMYLHVLKLTVYSAGYKGFDTTLTPGNFHIFEIMRTGTTLKGFIDGVQEATTHTMTASIGNSTHFIGSESGSGEHNSNMGQVLYYAGTPSGGDRTNLINYLGTYYGVTVTP